MTTWGRTRIEIIASREHIEGELQRGVPMKQIHDTLVQSGRMTVTYNSFRRQIRPIRDTLKMIPVKANHAGSGPDLSARLATRAEKHIPSAKAEPSGKFKFDPSRKTGDFF